MHNIPTTTGSYILWLTLNRKRRITVGKLGTHLFLPGVYAYCGSAFGPGGLRARLSHHLRPCEKPRWHIDYLKNVANSMETWFSTTPENLEHQFAEQLTTLPEATIPIPGFGSSDCNCTSHLLYFPGLPEISTLDKFTLTTTRSNT